MPHVTEPVVHHLENSRSLRVLWLLEELGQSYELREYARDPKTMRAPPRMRELHPLGKSPVVTIGARVLAESGAICESLIERYDEKNGLRPQAGSEAHEDYLYWMHFAEGTLMPVFLVLLIFEQIKRAKLPFFVKPIARAIAEKVDAAYTRVEMQKQFAFIEGHLATEAYFAGESFSAADIQMSYPIDAKDLQGELSARYPNTQAWLDKVKMRPGYQAAVARGGANALPTMRH